MRLPKLTCWHLSFCPVRPMLKIQFLSCAKVSNSSLLFSFISWQQLLRNFSWRFGRRWGESALVQCFGSCNRMLPNSTHLHVLLTLLLFQVIGRKYNGWASLKPAQKYILVSKDFLSRCLGLHFCWGKTV